MFCESYREALSAAAPSGGQMPAGARAHLEECASCRDSFSEEKALFALLDAELRTRVNAEMPASLLPRVQREIAASPAARTWHVPVLAYVASGLAIGAIALSFAVRTKVSPVKTEPLAGGVSSAISSGPSVARKENDSGPVLVATSKKNRRPPQAALNAEPEVLVSAEEQLGFQRYAASLRSTRAGAAGVINTKAVGEIEPLEIASVEVKQLAIQPLESGDAN